jgi:hypothetical protein
MINSSSLITFDFVAPGFVSLINNGVTRKWGYDVKILKV